MDACDFCGQPGYLRHGPDGPYSMIFCDRCYRWREIRALLIKFGAVIAAVSWLW
jgi:hypothetical protein